MTDKTKVHTQYRLKDGTRVPGTTTVIGVLGKDAIVHWAWQQGLENRDYRKVRDAAGDIGTLVHYMLMCHLTNTTSDVRDYSLNDIAQAHSCLQSYFEWEKEHKVEPILVETPLVSEIHRFGGTPDLLARVDGVDTLCDFKTSKGIYDEMIIQVASYRGLLVEAGYRVDRVRILRIPKVEGDNFEDVMVTGKLDAGWKIFLNCLSIYQSLKELRT